MHLVDSNVVFTQKSENGKLKLLWSPMRFLSVVRSPIPENHTGQASVSSPVNWVGKMC